MHERRMGEPMDEDTDGRSYRRSAKTGDNEYSYQTTVQYLPRSSNLEHFWPTGGGRGGAHHEHRQERDKRRWSSTGDADGLQALQDGYAEEVHVRRTVKLLPQVLDDKVQGRVLRSFCCCCCCRG